MQSLTNSTRQPIPHGSNPIFHFGVPYVLYKLVIATEYRKRSSYVVNYIIFSQMTLRSEWVFIVLNINNVELLRMLGP